MDENSFIACVIPTGRGRIDNLKIVLDSLAEQKYNPLEIIVVCDGFTVPGELHEYSPRVTFMEMPKHKPGEEPPRNVGVRNLESWAKYVWFLDSDVFVVPESIEAIWKAVNNQPERIICCPYDWLAPGQRDWKNWTNLRQELPDYRWSWFKENPSSKIFYNELGAALANFSGNLVWPRKLFQKVGGFHPDLSAGRVDDGELGLRACSHGIGTSFCRGARGFHLWHPRNEMTIRELNKKEVPKIQAWHPWVKEKGLVVSHEDGARFNRICGVCGEEINSLLWWEHKC